jgi:two-component system sensor histidine kinase KdpD
LRSQDAILDPATKEALLGTIIEESDRLNRFIGNLLDMTRLESGALKPRTSLNELSDVVGAVLRRASKILAGHRIAVDLPADLPLLALDMVLFEQVLFNLLDNAAKHAPGDSLITISASHDGDTVRLRVMDEGEGIPAGDMEKIFEKFYRAGGADRRRAGTGLGLAICRGFVEAMGGTIVAANRTDRRGAMFVITLPVPVNALLPEEETTS